MKVLEKSSPQSKIIYLFIFCFAGLILAGSLVMGLSTIIGVETMESPLGIRLSSAIQMVFMFFMPAYTLMIWSDYEPESFLGLKNFKDKGYLFWLAFLILLVSSPFINLLLQLNQSMALPSWLNNLEEWMQTLEASAETTTLKLLSGTSIWGYLGNILVVGVFAAVAEEVFFRGVLQQLLVKLFKNIHVGVCVTAFIFSLLHLQFYGFLPRFVLGLILGYSFVWSKSLWIPIFIHFLNNSLTISLNFFLKDNSIYNSLENTSISAPFVIFGLMCLILTVILFIHFHSKAQEEQSQS